MAALLRVTSSRCPFLHTVRAWASNYSFSAAVRSASSSIGYRWNVNTVAHKIFKLPMSNLTLPFPDRSFSPSATLSCLDLVTQGPKKTKLEETVIKCQMASITTFASKRPPYGYRERREKIEKIAAQFEQLRNQYGGAKCVVGVYITGYPPIGKTLLAHEIGEEYQTNSGLIYGKKPVVAMIDGRTPGSFFRSYIRLAENLGLPANHYTQFTHGNMEILLAYLSIDVLKKLGEGVPDWLLIIDGLSSECFSRFRASLPHPGEENWGGGQILVTTEDDHIVPYFNRFAQSYPMTELYNDRWHEEARRHHEEDEKQYNEWNDRRKVSLRTMAEEFSRSKLALVQDQTPEDSFQKDSKALVQDRTPEDSFQKDPKEVFISYKWEEVVRDFANDLAVELEIRHITCWKDDHEMIPGDDLVARITDGINECTIFIPILSEGYVSEKGHKWCRKECSMAADENKIIIPIQWGETNIPKEIRFMIRPDILRAVYNPESGPAARKQKLRDICEAVWKMLRKDQGILREEM